MEDFNDLLRQQEHFRVVLIDDDEDDACFVRDLLRSSGFSFDVNWVENATDGFEAIKRQDAAVYLLDYRLGEKTGLDILQELKPLMLQKPIILLTGSGTRETDLSAMEAGAWDFLIKDQLTTETLERSIRYCLYRAKDLEKLRLAEKAKLELDSAQAANRAKTEFLAHMSHEIRSPLTAILGFTKLALEPSSSESERVEFLEIIRRSGDHLLNVVNDILDVSKIEEGHLELESRIFDWSEPVSDVAGILRQSAVSKGLAFDVEIQPDLQRHMSGDAHRVRQILFNMLNNAIKFTSQGSVKLKITMGPSPASICFDVIDTGIGMTEFEQAKLFRSFSQANAGVSRQYGGTGLGLSLSKSLAEALGGRLFIESSKPGVGSTFRLSLPLTSLNTGPALSLPAAVSPTVTERVAVEHKRLKVLLVEDSPDNRLLVKHFLKFEAVDLEFACDGQAGIESGQREDFDAILMDIQMPNIDGYEATRRLRESGYDRPIIALTAHALTAERERILESGFDAFVSKPIQAAQLIETLRGVKRHALQLMA